VKAAGDLHDIADASVDIVTTPPVLIDVDRKDRTIPFLLVEKPAT
jgi:hypothetical protein